MDTSLDSKQIPLTFSTNGQDWFNYCAASNCLVQAVLTFNQQLDVGRLEKALRLSVDIEPVLGCKFTVDQNKPYWQRLDNLNNLDWCPLELAEECSDSVRHFLSVSLDTAKGPQIQARLIRSSSQDTLCLKLNHTCGDGGALKEYIRLLAGIYTSLEKGDVDIEPNINGNRDQTKLFDILKISNLHAHFRPELAGQPPTWSFPWDSQNLEPRIVKTNYRVIHGGSYERLGAFAKKENVSINDILLTAYYRSLFQMLQLVESDPMEIMVTVDQRRYLPDKKAESICNLSGAVRIRIGRIIGESFRDTLLRVSGEMNKLKESNPGVNSAILCELLGIMSFSQAYEIYKGGYAQVLAKGKSSPILSNFGVISNSSIIFGKNDVQEAYIVSPALYPPGFMLGASTYRGTLTLIVSYTDPGTQQKDVEEFLDLLCSELNLE